jgi:4-carboxymuconolactone decarboxylase
MFRGNRKRDLQFVARVSILAALGKTKLLERLLGRRNKSRKALTTAYEIALQTHLFAGFPASIEALFVVRRHIRGSDRIPTSSPGIGQRVKKGREICRRIYGGGFERLTERMQGLSPVFSKWIISYGYGTVLSRGGMSLVERELATVASLAVLGWDRQLRSHLQGALNVGARPSDVRKVVRIAGEYLPLSLARRNAKLAEQILNSQKNQKELDFVST